MYVTFGTDGLRGCRNRAFVCADTSVPSAGRVITCDQVIRERCMADMANHGKATDPLGDGWMRILWRKPSGNLAETTRRRVSVHLLPYLFFLYILAYLDRVNVSLAQFDMAKAHSERGLA